jgi:hypothetical protein
MPKKQLSVEDLEKEESTELRIGEILALKCAVLIKGRGRFV